MCFGRMLGEAFMLEAVYHNNLVAAKAITPQAIFEIVKSCQDKVQNYGAKNGRRYLAFLETLVTVNQVPVDQNQEMIIREILTHAGFPALDRYFWLEDQGDGNWAVTAET